MPLDEMKPSQEPAVERPLVSVTIPCFNEDESLSELVRRTIASATTAVGDKYEIILIDDGSTDRTWQIIDRMVLEDRHIVGVRLSRNHGHQLALSAGLSVARGDLVLVLDADLQDPPELLGPMLELMRQQSADVVYGKRRSRSGETRIKVRTAAIFYRLLARMTDIGIPLDTGDFRLMTRRVANFLSICPSVTGSSAGWWHGSASNRCPIFMTETSICTARPNIRSLRCFASQWTHFSVTLWRC